MAKYCIKYNDLQNQAASLQSISKTLASFEGRLNSIANAMDSRDSNMASLKTQVKSCAVNIPSLSGKVASASKVMIEISHQYRSAEKANYEAFSETKKKTWLTDSTMWKFIGDLGVPGSIISLIGKPVASWLFNGTIQADATDPKYYAGVLKSGLSAFKKLQSLNSKILNAKNLKLLGYAVNNVKYPFASWTTRFQAACQDSLSSSLKSFTKGGVKSAFAWSGVALTGVINGVSNYNDYKTGKITAERAVKGTILQTAIDVGKGIVVGAAATAVVGAACGAAPVIAVAAVSVGISVGIDYVSKKLTGKDFSKAASDAILDGVDSVKKNLNEGLNKLVNCFKNPFGNPKAAWAGSW